MNRRNLAAMNAVGAIALCVSLSAPAWAMSICPLVEAAGSSITVVSSGDGSMELSHEPIPCREGGIEFVPPSFGVASSAV